MNSSTRKTSMGQAMDHSRRRIVSAAASLIVLSYSVRGLAQGKQVQTLGWLHAGLKTTSGHFYTAFKERLAALGWREPTELLIEERWANGQYDQLPALAKELATRTPKLIVAAPSQSVAAAVKAAPHIPIVQATGGDPVAAGFAASLAKPGGMVTGVTNLTNDLTEKYFEYLVQAAPKVRRVGYLVDATTVTRDRLVKAAERGASRFSLELIVINVAKAEDMPAGISRLVSRGAQALVVAASPLLSSERERIAKVALAQRWPLVATLREFAQEGALLTYGVDTPALYRGAADYVDKILRGAKPGDLPMQQPASFELVVNLRTARRLGLAISQDLLVRADKVIE